MCLQDLNLWLVSTPAVFTRIHFRHIEASHLPADAVQGHAQPAASEGVHVVVGVVVHEHQVEEVGRPGPGNGLAAGSPAPGSLDVHVQAAATAHILITCGTDCAGNPAILGFKKKIINICLRKNVKLKKTRPHKVSDSNGIL